MGLQMKQPKSPLSTSKHLNINLFLIVVALLIPGCSESQSPKTTANGQVSILPKANPDGLTPSYTTGSPSQTQSSTNSTPATTKQSSVEDQLSSTKYPEISFEQTLLDLGELGQGTNHTCEFVFTNTGNAPLKITNISKTCGCTVPKLEKKQYAPNEQGRIQVKFISNITARHRIANRKSRIGNSPHGLRPGSLLDSQLWL